MPALRRAVTQRREYRDSFVSEHACRVEVAGEPGEGRQVAYHIALSLFGTHPRPEQDCLFEVQPWDGLLGAIDSKAEHQSGKERSPRRHFGERRTRTFERHSRSRQLAPAQQHHRLQVRGGRFDLLDVAGHFPGLHAAFQGLGPFAAHVGEHPVRV